MDPITIGAAGGLRARMEALDMLANNISNAATAGFKRDGEFYGLFEDAEAIAWGSGTATLPVIEKTWTDFSQGVLNATGSQFDLALSGPGFFAVNGPSGPLYTRNGSLHVAASGQVLSQEGYPVRMEGDTTLRVQPGPFEVAMDGTVRQAGTVLGRLELRGFPTGSLAKHGSSYFRPNDPNIVGTPVPGTEVHQGKLEGANVSSAESAVRMVTVMRQFEALQKAITLGGEMNRKAIEELARVGS